jgi:hypothetical protein
MAPSASGRLKGEWLVATTITSASRIASSKLWVGSETWGSWTATAASSRSVRALLAEGDELRWLTFLEWNRC